MLFVYSLKRVLRSRMFVFWNIVFPLLLMFCLNAAMGNLRNIENSIDPIPAVLVKEGEGLYQDSFEDTIEGLSSADADNRLFELTYCNDRSQAEEKLYDGTEIMFVVTSDDILVSLAPDHSDTAGVVAKSVADSYRQNYALISEAYERDPQSAASVIEAITSSSEDGFCRPVENAFSQDPDHYSWFYYSTFVMGILFNVLLGVNMVAELAADVEGSAMRYSLSPVKKSRMILSAFAARLVTALAVAAIHLTVMKFALGLSLGNDPLKLIVFVLAGEIFSICFGIVMGFLFKGDLNSRGNKATAVLMVSVFLGGEMINILPGVLEKYCPIVNDINPATVLNQAFFKLAVCGNDADYYVNIAKIIVFAILFLVISIIILRRERYASL